MALTLEAVETAIGKIASGAQSWMVDGIQYTKANLATLMQLRRDLKDEEATAGHSQYGFGIRPMKPPEH